MGYFPNATAWDIYESQHCRFCKHAKRDQGCTVQAVHFLYNYDECNKDNSILDHFIPRSKDGLNNERCTMFTQNTRCQQTMDLFDDADKR